MRVLITGGAGYIGSHTAKMLSRSGTEPVVVDNLSKGHTWAARWGDFVEADLADTDALRRILREFQITSVIHFAGSINVGESVQRPGYYFRNNVTNTLSLLDAMCDTGVQEIVFSSSAAVYGAPQTLPLPEDHPKQPVSPYGDSKLFVERVLDWYGQAHGLRWAALRYFNASGADDEGEIGEDHDPETHLIPLVIQAALGRRDKVGIFGTDYPTEDGTCIRDYVHVMDLADAHARALLRLQQGDTGLQLNLGTGRGYSVREIIAAVEAVSGRTVPTREDSRRPGDPPALVADPRRAHEVLGWQPEYSDLTTIVETAWRWHLGHMQ